MTTLAPADPELIAAVDLMTKVLRLPPAVVGFHHGVAARALIYDYRHPDWPLEKSSYAYELGWAIGNHARRRRVPPPHFVDGQPTARTIEAAVDTFSISDIKGNQQ